MTLKDFTKEWNSSPSLIFISSEPTRLVHTSSSSQATLGLPPDFNRLRQCQEQVEQGQRGYFEINKLRNIPAFNSDAIFAAIERLASRFDGVEQRLDGIVGRLDVMDTRQQAAYVSYTPLNDIRMQC